MPQQITLKARIMEHTDNSGLIKYTMTHGAYLGVALIILHLIFYFTKMVNTSISMVFIPSLLFMGVFIIGIVYASKKYRDHFLDGYINYRTALYCGVLVSLFSGIIYGFYYYIFNGFIDTGYYGSTLTAFQKTITQFMLTYKLPDDQIERQLSVFKSPIPSAFDMSMSKIMATTFFGLLLSLVTSAFIKKEQNLFSDNLK